MLTPFSGPCPRTPPPPRDPTSQDGARDVRTVAGAFQGHAHCAHGRALLVTKIIYTWTPDPTPSSPSCSSRLPDGLWLNQGLSAGLSRLHKPSAPLGQVAHRSDSPPPTTLCPSVTVPPSLPLLPRRHRHLPTGG